MVSSCKIQILADSRSASFFKDHHTYRCDDTRGYVMQFWPPDDEHMCSKHVEARNKIIVRQNILCIKLVNYWDKYTEMHGQQNVKKKG